MLDPDLPVIPPSKALSITLMRDNAACFAELIAPYAVCDITLGRNHSIFPERILSGGPPLLSVACFLSAPQIAAYLISHGADMRLTDQDGVPFPLSGLQFNLPLPAATWPSSICLIPSESQSTHRIIT
jgi:hypothetical protein